MAYVGYVTNLKNVRKHPNADRLMLAECFGNTVIVSLDMVEGQTVVYFPVDGQLSEEYCKVNDLVRRKDENGNPCGGYLDPDKRNIRALKLRGEKSDGLVMPLTSLANFTTVSDLKVGDTIDVLNGVEICRKYIPVMKNAGHHGGGGTGRVKVNFAPTFHEHIDTPQLAYNMNAFKTGDVVELTLKMHGTSGRTGYLPLLRQKPQNFFEKLFKRPVKTYQEYGYVTGTRRVVLDDKHDGGFYEDNSFRKVMAAKFENKLHKGETAYYEIVGFQGPGGAPIMSSVDNAKISDKAFTKQYGKTTIFSYGCDPRGDYERQLMDNDMDDDCYLEPCCEVYVYRMTSVNEDDDVVEYTPDQVRARCEQMGVKCVPMFERFIVPDDCDAGEYVLRKVEQYFDGPDPVGKTHVREGVVVRVVSSPTIKVFKHKNHTFKMLSGIAIERIADGEITVDETVLEEM